MARIGLQQDNTELRSMTFCDIRELISVYKAAFFDLDGTLVDTERIYSQSLHQTMLRRGAEISLCDVHSACYGRGWNELYEVLNSKLQDRFIDADEMVSEVSKQFHSQLSRNDIDCGITGSVLLARHLAKRMPIAVISGSSRQDIVRLLERINLLDTVSFVLGYEDYAKGKPSPDGYRSAAEKLRVRPEQCIVFEDSQPGIRSARSAGMYCVAVRHSQNADQDTSEADWIVDDLSILIRDGLPMPDTIGSKGRM